MSRCSGKKEKPSWTGRVEGHTNSRKAAKSICIPHPIIAESMSETSALECVCLCRPGVSWPPRCAQWKTDSSFSMEKMDTATCVSFYLCFPRELNSPGLSRCSVLHTLTRPWQWGVEDWAHQPQMSDITFTEHNLLSVPKECGFQELLVLSGALCLAGAVNHLCCSGIIGSQVMSCN